MPRVKAPPPQFVNQIPAMLVSERPFDLAALGWLYEIKYDGYRCVAEFGSGACYLRSKTGGDMTAWFPEIAKSLAGVPGGPHVVDGEVVVLDDIGRSDFDKLHTRAQRRRFIAGMPPVAYAVFDVLVADGDLTMHLPLVERKAMIVPLLGDVPNILPVGHFEADGQTLFDQAVLPLKLEGLVAKKVDSFYKPGTRTNDWVKVKRKGAIPPGRFRRSDARP